MSGLYLIQVFLEQVPTWLNPFIEPALFFDLCRLISN